MPAVVPPSPERWARIRDIYSRLSDVPEDQQGPLVRNLCDGDREIEREIQELLSAHKRAGSFLNDPPTLPLGSVFPPGAAGELTSGTVLGSRFHIIRHLNTGGMGAVYEAWDLELQEVLALKGGVSTIYNIAFSPDGRSLASASFEGLGAASVRLWEAPPEVGTHSEDKAALLTPEYVLGWHLNEAEDCMRAGQLAAARWHVERLGNPPLTDALLNARLVAIRAAVGR